MQSGLELEPSEDKKGVMQHLLKEGRASSSQEQGQSAMDCNALSMEERLSNWRKKEERSINSINWVSIVGSVVEAEHLWSCTK